MSDVYHDDFRALGDGLTGIEGASRTSSDSGQPSRDENASEGRRGRHVAGVAERHDGKRTTRVE
jgi:hypothetical protein